MTRLSLTLAALGAILCLIAAPDSLPAQESEETTAAAYMTVPVTDPDATAAGQPEPLPLGVFGDATRRPIEFDPRDGQTMRTRPQSNTPDFRSTATIPVARYNGEVYTNIDLQTDLQYRRPVDYAALAPGDILALPAEKIRDVISSYVYERLARDKARTLGIDESTSAVKEAVSGYREDALFRAYFERFVAPRLDNLEERALEATYEKRKDAEFTQPAAWIVREIPFLLYHSVTAAEGDTLESLAERISGSQDAAARILRDDAYRYPRISPASESGLVPIADLRPGEKLLVPFSPEDITSVTRIADRAVADLKGGADFDEVFRRTRAPDDDTTTAAPFVPFMDGVARVLRDAILEMKKGDIAGPVRGPHALHVLTLVDQMETKTLTFEEVRDTLVLTDDERLAKINELRAAVFDELREKYGVKINEEVLRRDDYLGDDPLPATTVIVSAPDFTYVLDQFIRAMLPTMKTWNTMTFEERLNLAKSAPEVTRYVLLRAAEEEDISQGDEFQRMMESKVLGDVVSAYVERLREADPPPSEADLREYYRKNIDRFTEPAEVTVREITKRINLALPQTERAAGIETARRQLESIRSHVKTEDDFAQAARRESQAVATRSRGGLIGTVPADFRGEVVRNQLNQIQPGEVTEPFLYGAEMMILRLDAMRPPTPRPFEEVLPQLRILYGRERPRQLLERDKEQLLKDANFELLF